MRGMSKLILAREKGPFFLSFKRLDKKFCNIGELTFLAISELNAPNEWLEEQGKKNVSYKKIDFDENSIRSHTILS